MECTILRRIIIAVFNVIKVSYVALVVYIWNTVYTSIRLNSQRLNAMRAAPTFPSEARDYNGIGELKLSQKMFQHLSVSSESIYSSVVLVMRASLAGRRLSDGVARCRRHTTRLN